MNFLLLWKWLGESTDSIILAAKGTTSSNLLHIFQLQGLLHKAHIPERWKGILPKDAITFYCSIMLVELSVSTRIIKIPMTSTSKYLLLYLHPFLTPFMNTTTKIKNASELRFWHIVHDIVDSESFSFPAVNSVAQIRTSRWWPSICYQQ